MKNNKGNGIKAICVIVPKLASGRAILISENYTTRSKQVQGSVIKYFQTEFAKKDYPVKEVEEKKPIIDTISDYMALNGISTPQKNPSKIFSQITIWLDPDYSFFIRDKNNVPYYRDLELLHDDNFVDFTSTPCLKKLKLAYEGIVPKKDINFTILYSRNGTFICSKGTTQPVKLPGIRLIKVVVKFNPSDITNKSVKVELVYDNGTDSPGIIPFTIDRELSKKRVGL